MCADKKKPKAKPNTRQRITACQRKKIDTIIAEADAPKPKEALIELQTALWRAFPDCDDVRRFAGGFVPHLSVGQLRGREQMQQFVAALSRDWETVTFEVSVVSLIWREDPPHDVFRVAQTFALGTA